MPEPENPFFWLAFNDLRGSRPMGMEPGAIPISEIKAYADLYGITCPVQVTRLIRFVRALDHVERQHHGNTSPAS